MYPRTNIGRNKTLSAHTTYVHSSVAIIATIQISHWICVDCTLPRHMWPAGMARLCNCTRTTQHFPHTIKWEKEGELDDA